jgi:replicative DNA helicase
VKEEIEKAVRGRLFIKEFPTKSASVQTIRAYLKRLETLENFRPDILVVDYADLLRSSRSYGEKRHELESNYEELRGLGQEFDCVVVTADQTNRSGLDQEVVTLSAISEAYAKATVCDLIMTVSRRREDKVTNTGKLFIAKSRLGADGKVFPFLMDGSTVKVKVLDEITDSDLEQMLGSTAPISSQMKERFERFGLSQMVDE